MNSALAALVSRALLVCIACFACQCSSPDAGAPVPAQTAKPVLFREADLKARVQKLKRGDSMKRCVSLLGEPTTRQEIFPKTRGTLVCTNFSYVVRQRSSNLNTSTDRYLYVYFDSTDQMLGTAWYGQP